MTETLDNDSLDSLCYVLEFGMPVRDGEGPVQPTTIDKLRSTCQEMLLRLHPDKRSSKTSADADASTNSSALILDEGDSELAFGKALQAWKVLAKYSDHEAESNELIRKIHTRQMHLKYETGSTLKPLWRIVGLTTFQPIGMI